MRIITKSFILFFSIVWLTLTNSSFSQFTEFHPELDWFTIKGNHAEVHYHAGAERTARVVLKIMDEVWEPITSLYGYQPETIHFVIKDIDDYSNGGTYFFDNKIEIWTSALDFDLRGTHNWLRNVISHEFTHMVQIQASMKSKRSLPAVFLQVLNYEDERRPDILYGFPNIVASYPIATINVPAWFAEGTAQYMRPDFNYDNWDTHRDMILRSYALDGNMLTWNQMGVFGKTSLGNESVYNAGYALTRYISQKYGEDKLEQIAKALGKLSNFTIDAAFKDVLGKDGNEIYDEWRSYVTASYKERIADIKASEVSGEKVRDEGFGNFYPLFAPDGNSFIYISNKTSDYFGPAGIYRYNLNLKNERLLVNNVRSTIAWADGGKKIVYSKLTDDNPNWRNIHDLYIYDIAEDEETRLTEGLRANQPDVSRDGKNIVFLFEKDGTTNIAMVDINGKNYKQLTSFNNGEQVYNPKFSNDGKYIVFDFSMRQERDIVKINVDGTGYQDVVKTSYDERNPAFDKNGNLIYASDETGIYNIYSMNLETKEKKQLTNVIGGAFMPSVDDKGNLLYAGYTSTGYKIFEVKANEQEKALTSKNYVWQNNPPTGTSKPKGDVPDTTFTRLRNFDDTKTPDYKPEKYKGVFTSLTFLPFLRYDNYNTSNGFFQKLKPGLYVSSTDMLDRYAIYAGGSINSRMERDLFLTFEYRNRLPLLFDLGIKPQMSLEVYNITRKADTQVAFGVDSTNGEEVLSEIANTDVTYNLFEVDLIAKHQVFFRGSDLELRYIYSTYSALLGSFVIPNLNQLYPATDDTYLKGSNFQVKYNIESLASYKDAEINPIGIEAELKYNYEINRYNDSSSYEVKDGVLSPLYSHYDFHRLEFNTKLHFPLWFGHTLTAQIRAGSILNNTVPDFFDFYLGGLIGMKAYPFYAISGNKIGWLNLTYRFPLFRNIDARVGHIYIDKIFMSVYGDFGDAWNGKEQRLKDVKKGAGAELRVQMNSYYMFPTMLFFNASYGFDQFSREVNHETITYGKEWRFYGGILFGFDF